MAQAPDIDARLAAILRVFPNARRLEITSAPTRDYNCVAWAMGEEGRNWWPVGHGAGYWPPGTMRRLTREAFRWAFASQGYEPCEGGALVAGVEKVCLYEKGGIPTHAALQLSTGRWSSKLGPDEDVEHDLGDLEGRRYGRPAAWFARPVRGSTTPAVAGVVARSEPQPPDERR